MTEYISNDHGIYKEITGGRSPIAMRPAAQALSVWYAFCAQVLPILNGQEPAPVPFSDDELLNELVEAARNYKMTPDEIFEQRVSFVYGQLPGDHPWGKEQVRQYLRSQGL